MQAASISVQATGAKQLSGELPAHLHACLIPCEGGFLQ